MDPARALDVTAHAPAMDVAASLVPARLLLLLAAPGRAPPHMPQRNSCGPSQPAYDRATLGGVNEDEASDGGGRWFPGVQRQPLGPLGRSLG
jgi:hypothetical protein